MASRFRVLTWVCAYIDMCLQMNTFLGVLMIGYILISNSFKSTTFSSNTLLQWFALAVYVILVLLDFCGCKKLIQATQTSGKAEIAYKLTHLWWITKWIYIAFEFPMFIIDTFIKPGMFFPSFEGYFDSPIDSKTVTIVIFAIIYPFHVFMLICVYQFRREMKSAIPHYIAHELPPLDTITVEIDSKQQNSSP